MAKNKEKHILYFDLRILYAIHISLKYVKVPKSVEMTEAHFDLLSRLRPHKVSLSNIDNLSNFILLSPHSLKPT
jgi:AAA15 family ATPase/GTPase